MRIAQIAIVCVVALTLLCVFSSSAMCCPFCSAPSLTLSEQLAQNDAVVLVQWVNGRKAKDKNPGTTTYEIVRIVKTPKGTANKGDRITLARYRVGEKGDLFMLTGSQGTLIEWSSPLEVSETSFNYVAQAPSPELPTEKRLAYFLKFLEFPDPLVANDAYAEFANAPYNRITLIAKQLPRERIRKWIASSDTPATRLGLYGLMLGLCGEEEDAHLMKQKIAESNDEFRLGIDGVISGYLLLTGEDGLELIDRAKLQNEDVPFSETYAAMQALRFMWKYNPDRIEKERLRQSMRILLDRPKLADLVITDLARWKDWSVQDKLMSLYGAEEYNIPSIKRAIVRYMLVSIKDLPQGESVKIPEHVENGKKHMLVLRQKDPKTVREAERFFFLR